MKWLLLLVLGAQTLMAGPGFFPIKDPAIAKPVSKAAEKAVRVWVFGPKPSLKVPPQSREAFRKQLEEGVCPPLARLGVFDKNVAKFYLAELAKLDGKADYLIYPLTTTSGFFLGQNTLVSARHILTNRSSLEQAYVDAPDPATARKELAKWKGRLVLTDFEGRVRFDSAKEGSQIERVLFSGHPMEAKGLSPEFQKIETSALLQLLDIVFLELKGGDFMDLGLSLAKEIPKTGEEVFALGYPLASKKRFSEFQVPDSDGLSVRIAKGKVLAKTPEDHHEALGKIMEAPERSLYENSLLFTDLDFVPGLSGGAIVNLKGEVVSLASTVRFNFEISPYDRYTVTTSYGPRFHVLKSLFPEAD